LPSGSDDRAAAARASPRPRGWRRLREPNGRHRTRAGVIALLARAERTRDRLERNGSKYFGVLLEYA